MLTEPNYIIQQELVYASPDLLSRYNIAVSIDVAGFKNPNAFYGFLSCLDRSFQYSFYLHGKEIADADFSGVILPFFLSANYMKIGLSPKILVDATIRNSFATIIISALISQGLGTSAIEYTNELENHGVKIIDGDDQDALKEGYRMILSGSPVASSNTWMRVKNIDEILSAEKLLEDEDELFQLNNEKLYSLKMQLREVTEKFEHSNRSLTAAQNELMNLNSHLEQIRGSGQASELQHYYDNEYEILPVWYKKFGHVLKVLIGKRNLKSLSNEDVKKYKD